MDDGSLPSALSVLGLIALHALIALAYASLTNMRRANLRERAESGDEQARRALRVLEDAARLQITYQLSGFLLNFTIAVLATATVAQPLILTAAVPAWVVYAAVLAATVLLAFILGELVPGAIGQAHAEWLGMTLLFPFQVVIALLSPLVMLLLAISRVISAVFGSSGAVNSITEEEILTLAEAAQKGGTIEDEEKEMIYSVLQLDQTIVREIMVPRIDIVALEIGASVQEALATFITSGFSRVPVYDDSIDNVKGLLYAKDLLAMFSGQADKHRPIRDMLRPAYFVPETKRADVLLKELQNQNVHIAIVVDEYGGTAGIVTIENLIEEIIGDIRDEYDLNEEVEYVQHGEHEWTVDASIDLDDFNTLIAADLPTEENDTLGGFIYSRLGRVPRITDTVEHKNLTLRVETVDGRRIRKVRVVRTPPPVEEPKNETQSQKHDTATPRTTATVPAVTPTQKPLADAP